MALTVAQHRAKLQKQLKELTTENQPLFLGVNTAVSMLVERIFEHGKDSTESPIILKRKHDPGTGYSTTPIYVNPIDSPRKFPVMGKNGDTGKVGKNKRKTRYFADGYRGFRRTIGREHAKINLRLTNDLQSDISNAPQPKGGRMVPAKNRKPTKVNANTYVVKLKRPINRKKVAGLDKRNGTPIFKHTKEEKDELFKVIEFETFRLFNK